MYALGKLAAGDKKEGPTEKVCVLLSCCPPQPWVQGAQATSGLGAGDRDAHGSFGEADRAGALRSRRPPSGGHTFAGSLKASAQPLQEDALPLSVSFARLSTWVLTSLVVPLRLSLTGSLRDSPAQPAREECSPWRTCWDTEDPVSPGAMSGLVQASGHELRAIC